MRCQKQLIWKRDISVFAKIKSTLLLARGLELDLGSLTKETQSWKIVVPNHGG